MLIDDDTITNTMNSMIIGKVSPKSEIQICLNGEFALQILFNEDAPKPDVILLDINMPVMNGWEFLRVLSTEDFNIDIHMLTSSKDPSEEESSLAYTFVKSFVSKPLDYSKFKDIVNASGLSSND